MDNHVINITLKKGMPLRDETLVALPPFGYRIHNF